MRVVRFFGIWVAYLLQLRSVFDALIRGAWLIIGLGVLLILQEPTVLHFESLWFNFDGTASLGVFVFGLLVILLALLTAGIAWERSRGPRLRFSRSMATRPGEHHPSVHRIDVVNTGGETARNLVMKIATVSPISPDWAPAFLTVKNDANPFERSINGIDLRVGEDESFEVVYRGLLSDDTTGLAWKTAHRDETMVRSSPLGRYTVKIGIYADNLPGAKPLSFEVQAESAGTFEFRPL